MAKQEKPISKAELMSNVNRWRLKHNRPVAYHEKPQEFKANFNRIGEKMRGPS